MLEMLKSYWKVFKWLIGYYILCFLLFLSLTSLFTFFHLILGHDFSTLESWLYQRKVFFIVATKLVSFFILYRWYSLNASMRMSHLKQKIKLSYQSLLPLFWIGMVTFMASWFYDIELNEQQVINFGDDISLFVFTVLYLAIDWIVISIFFERNTKTFKGELFFIPLFFTLMSSVFIYQISTKIFGVYAVYFFLSYLIFVIKDWCAIAIYLFLVSIPLSLIYPFNFFYGRDNCLFFLLPSENMTLLFCVLIASFLVFPLFKRLHRVNVKN